MKWLAKLILRRSGGVSKTKAGAAIQFGAESAFVVAVAAFVSAKWPEWGAVLGPEEIALIITALFGKFINKVGVRDAMTDPAETVAGELLHVEQSDMLDEDRVREIVRDAVAHRELGGL